MVSWQDEISDIERQGKIEELRAHTRRVQYLKKQRAVRGGRTDPHVLIEIEDIESEIARLKQDLGLSRTRARPSVQIEPDLVEMFRNVEASLHELKALVEQGQIIDREVSNRILEAMQQGRMEQGEIAETVESLRHWAKSVQKTGLPVDPELRTAILKMAQPVQGKDGMYNYLHFVLPLLPGLLSVESEIDLNKLWEEIKRRWG